MKTVAQLAPLAVVVAIVSGITWILLDREVALGPWLLAALLLAHGGLHLALVVPRPSWATAGGMPWPFQVEDSWLVGSVGLDAGVVRGIGITIMAIVVGDFVLAALSTLGIVVPTAWWPALVGGSAAMSLLIGLFFSPSLLVGTAIDVALLWFVASSAWRPGEGLFGA